MLCTWARDHDIVGTGVDLSSAFVASAATRARELGVDSRVLFEHARAPSSSHLRQLRQPCAAARATMCGSSTLVFGAEQVEDG
jgi:hypothetical protein